MNDMVYLRPNIYFEPLINNWFAWPYLLAPAQSAMFLRHQIRIMKSFISNARIHVHSSADKKMTGSSLVTLSESDVSEVSLIIDRILNGCADLLELSDGIKALDEMLRTQATGMSLEPLYGAIPPNIRGYVELQYDLNNHPSFRFFEGLLYQSKFYRLESQSLRFGSLRSDERSFVLSTPRLPDKDHIHINLPFNHEITDLIFSMRDTPYRLSELKKLISKCSVTGGLDFDNLFTDAPPPKKQKCNEGVLQIQYIGHAGLLIETADITIMVDPVIGYLDGTIKDKFTFSDAPPHIDIVLITHAHMDHCSLETLIQLKTKISTLIVPKNNSGSLADPSLKLMLKALGFKSVIELEDMESYAIPEGNITAIPFLGEHADLCVSGKSGWFVNLMGNKILVAADSSNLDEKLYSNIQGIIGDIDALFIGMECRGAPLKWLYGPLLTKPISNAENESRRFNGSNSIAAARISEILNASKVYVYALGIEEWYRYFMGISYSTDNIQMLESEKLVRSCIKRGVHSEILNGYKFIRLSKKVE